MRPYRVGCVRAHGLAPIGMSIFKEAQQMFLPLAFKH